MSKSTLFLAIILHMHQPRYNLAGATHESEVARDVFAQTMHPYTYPPELIGRYEDARVTFNFTGSLIEQLNELAKVNFDSRLTRLWEKYREVKKLNRIDIMGCGYFHPIFPLIPEEDRRRQIEMQLRILEETFGVRPTGFWLPELAFTTKLIPLLGEMGFKWIIVDEPHVLNVNRGRKRVELLYRPHYVECEGYRIIVIPRDRGISNAQQSGYNPIWLRNEVKSKIQPDNEGDLLLTVATDGENGWFRHSGENAGFWGWFYEPLLYLLTRDPDFQFIKLTTPEEYLRNHPPEDTVVVEDGSWNVPEVVDDGRFLKWTEGKGRREAWVEILETSKLVQEADGKIRELGSTCPLKLREILTEAWRWLLMAETSCHFWWGTKEWLDRSRFCCSKAKERASEILQAC